MAAHEWNPGQTITACGRLRSITVQMRRSGSPRFNIRANIYLTVPDDWDIGWPLSNYVGQSTNVITSSTLDATFGDVTFLFDDLEVSGQWTVVFTYETVTTHNEFNYVLYATGSMAPDGSIYSGGDFVYYIVDSDTWYIFPYGDMVFSCTYCEGECTTTTTEEQRPR